MELVLVHSPLVGPATWRWVAEVLSEAGHGVVVPDLRGPAATGQPHEFIVSAMSAIPSTWSRPVIVGHSGAGFFLPSIGEAVDAASLAFVDAGLPPRQGLATPGGEFLDRLRSLAIDGTLPRWSTWWGDTLMRSLVPDDVRRVQVEAEMGEVPLAFYESLLDLPSGWEKVRGAFLQLSDAYGDDASRARSLGWPVIERLGGHLDGVNHPDDVARSIIELIHRPASNERP